MVDLKDFALAYFNSIWNLARTVSNHAKNHIPPCLTQTAFVVAISDYTNRHMIELISASNAPSIMVDGQEIHYYEARGTILLARHHFTPIERYLFPSVSPGASESITIGSQNTVLTGLTFCNKEYNNKYWNDATFARITAGDMPFYVGNNGSLLGISLAYGYELNGERQERRFEYIKIYGNEKMMPDTNDEMLGEATRDFIIASTGIGEIGNPFNISKYFESLSRHTECVMILGPYRSARTKFDQLKSALKALGYDGFTLDDLPDLPDASLSQKYHTKLFAGLLGSSFVIVVDNDPSGHIAELQDLLRNPWRRVVVVRNKEKPSTSYLEDGIRNNSCFRVAEVAEITVSSLAAHIRWAKGQ